MSRFDLSTVLVTISAAVPRVLPHVFKWPAPAPSEVYDVIVALNPAVSHYLLTAFAIAVQFVLTVSTQSYAWNDRVWPFLPPLWGILYALHPYLSHDRKTDGKLDLRLSVMTVLTVVWGLRLAFHGIRRGCYSWGHEDYRFLWLRTTKITNRFLFFSIYVWFVLGHCTVMLTLISTPFYFAWIRRGDSPAFNVVDFVATLGMTLGVVVQAVADEQHWRYHLRKKAYQLNQEAKKSKDTGDEGREVATSDEEDGFYQSGLFAWCRHPNYFAEMTIWFFFYLFSVSCSGRWLNWCVAGPILYVGLFLLTTPMVEAISSSKYPAYKVYQKRVSRFIPSYPHSKKTQVNKEE